MTALLQTTPAGLRHRPGRALDHLRGLPHRDHLRGRGRVHAVRGRAGDRRPPGEATLIGIKLGVGTRPAGRRGLIARRFPGLTALDPPDEAVRAGANGQLLANVTLVIVVLALLIGGIGVMTRLMAVVERRSEFALLSAGWSGPCTAGLVLTEGTVVSRFGATPGTPGSSTSVAKHARSRQRPRRGRSRSLSLPRPQHAQPRAAPASQHTHPVTRARQPASSEIRLDHGTIV